MEILEQRRSQGKALLLTLAGLFLGSQAMARMQENPAQTGKLFQRSCAGCHTVPDPGIRTDRVWLQQIQQTR